MAHLDPIETRAAANLDALYWWRRHESREAQPAEPLTQRIVALAERVTPALSVPEPAQISPSPRNRLPTSAEARRLAERVLLERQTLDAELHAAIQRERRRATCAIALSLIATAASAAATLSAAATHEPVALGLALAGSVAASLALYRALCRLLPISAGDGREMPSGTPVIARYRSRERHL